MSPSAASAVNKASQIFYKDHGVREIDVFIVTCSGRQNMQNSEVLEAALIHTFWNIYRQIPKKNKKKPAYVEGRVRTTSIEKIIHDLPT